MGRVPQVHIAHGVRVVGNKVKRSGPVRHAAAVAGDRGKVAAAPSLSADAVGDPHDRSDGLGGDGRRRGGRRRRQGRRGRGRRRGRRRDRRGGCRCRCRGGRSRSVGRAWWHCTPGHQDDRGDAEHSDGPAPGTTMSCSDHVSARSFGPSAGRETLERVRPTMRQEARRAARTRSVIAGTRSRGTPLAVFRGAAGSDEGSLGCVAGGQVQWPRGPRPAPARRHHVRGPPAVGRPPKRRSQVCRVETVGRRASCPARGCARSRES